MYNTPFKYKNINVIKSTTKNSKKPKKMNNVNINNTNKKARPDKKWVLRDRTNMKEKSNLSQLH